MGCANLRIEVSSAHTVTEGIGLALCIAQPHCESSMTGQWMCVALVTSDVTAVEPAVM